MTLATVTAGAAPSARIVLLKHFDVRGFVFYTNYDSRKGCELVENPRATLVFYWAMQRRQVCILGTTTKVGCDESRTYFDRRPRGSQLGAWVSDQSCVISNRQILDRKLRQAEAEFSGKPVSLPPNWGGFRVVPTQIEFWQHRANRLHDRLRYTHREDGTWLIERLAP
jgi:pyridoxamine 5'-phosphate oxidase